MPKKDGRSKIFELCVARWPRISVFKNDRFRRTSDGHQEGKNQSAILSECGKTLPSKIEKDHRWVLISGDPKTIAIRTPLPMRMCSNSGLDTVKKNHAFQHGHCTKVITRSAGRTKKTRRRSSKQICIQELTLGEESVIKKENSWSTQAHSMHIMSDSDLCPQRARHISEIQRIFYDCYGAWINQNDRRKATVYVRDLDMFSTVQLLEDFTSRISRYEHFPMRMSITLKGL